MTEPEDDDPTLEMDDEETACLRELHLADDEDAELLCLQCCGVIGMTCSCPTEVP